MPEYPPADCFRLRVTPEKYFPAASSPVIQMDLMNLVVLMMEKVKLFPPTVVLPPARLTEYRSPVPEKSPEMLRGLEHFVVME